MRTVEKYVLVALVLAAVITFVIAAEKPIITHRLKADVVTRNADIGIPGITKMYKATLTNRGLLPSRVTRCNFIDDTMSPGTMVAYAVQRWNETTKQWDTMVEFGKSEFCKPYPLGIVKATVADGWLWPGKSLSTGEEATAARDAFNVGDRARFVIFTGDPGDHTTSVATPGFSIDEHRQGNANFRVKH